MAPIKDSLLEKMRVIEAQYRESQHKVQNIERSVDILERNH